MGQKVQTQQNNNSSQQSLNKEPSSNVNPHSYPSMVNKNSGNNIYQNIYGPNNTLIPNNRQMNMNTQVYSKGVITYMDLKEAFQKHQVDGYLNRERFNETILSILKFDIPVISYTYLSERLFDLLDDSSDGRIQEEEFIAGMRNVFSTREVREKLSFMAMMRKKNIKNTTIDANAIFEYFYNSWLYGFRILCDNINKDKNEYLQRNIPIPTRQQIEEFASKFDTKIRSFVIDDLKECGIDPSNVIEFDQFKRWLMRDNTLQICYGHKGINVATSLVCLDEIGYVDNSQQIGQYPTFK